MEINPQELVLYQDDSLLAINKPAGLRTLPDGYDPSLPHVRSLFSPLFGPIWIVHRLDRYTSGVLLLARTAQAHRALNTQFETHSIRKTYHALVIGNPEWDEMDTRQPLRSNGDRQHRTVIDPLKGKLAVTHLHVLERLGRFALLEASPETGRTHQIRAHLADLGLPLIGDYLYGKQANHLSGDEVRLDRVALHARSLDFNHPISGERLSLEAPYPDDFESLLSRLRGH